MIIGATLSGLTSYLIELQRWKRARRDKRDEATKQAVEAALTWIDPMYKAVVSAEVQGFRLLSGLQPGGGDEDAFRKNYPDVLSNLAKLDLHVQQRPLVPRDTYPEGQEIAWKIEEFKYGILELWHKPNIQKTSRNLVLSTPVWNAGNVRLKSANKSKHFSKA